MKNETLFSDFDAVSTKQWKQKIQFDLKGADYNDTLVWESIEGIKVKPFYDASDRSNTTSFSLPKDHSWKIGEAIYTGNPKLANERALQVLSKDVQSLVFQIPDGSISMAELLSGIDLTNPSIHFELGFLDPDFFKNLLSEFTLEGTNIHFNVDIIGNLARSGNWFDSLKKDHQFLEETVRISNDYSLTSVLSVDMALYQNAGANCVQQLAYALAHANEYLNHFDNTKAKEKPVVFDVAIGQNYFFEIAKLQALRLLWQNLSSEYGLNHDCHIKAIPSKRNKTLYDYNVNMLRSTSECMAAILGGANTVCNLPYDAIYHKENEFGTRTARNQLLLLKEESYFQEAVHAAGGSFYLNSLINQMSEKALILFKQLEAGGGFLENLKNGTIQRKIKENAKKEQELFDSKDTTLVGTNKYINEDDRMSQDLELYPFLKKKKKQTIIEPILEYRLAEGIEQNRLKQES
ncbi:methylmalonyl-CoA mutase subunit beta [Croceivirga thetidis]|uniref:Methylmalonyl-CoA mutase n=1 Tax=Croceivirga thetidis TaxID=2721623 RepID=A0ABX1GS89_9FLAO|nr:methylmalonyl-CoA mutase subunit beta [Croceivirga thetidis]NKI32813.1 methylmalonyl-CoA mutase [Croceivirga thetidis]